ncbi:DegT/DnrJ/EryC1/StrS family aminotransferase [Streptomyces cacaoi]|uniref:Aminotransferase DegT n=1 Tax=Streptomyces cacaoi TaxID=1898 RepID=A0A4Y3R669_STRCI|nr:DegT/DnrJ/EryC1/StrS family aminotransferase [Streptomyces cacaoi]NNG89460.1 DegT/DnrJ/EryC1/StrS family aminotransferase [Streptomyces cacaoi]GEB53062.1 aminotransferase DegT [Streptomyces cacaoi]
MQGPREEMIPAAKPQLGDEEIAAAVRVLRGGRVVQGPEVAAFEGEFGALVADRSCVAVNSGTSALHLALLALGIGPGDEVVVPSFSFAASANAVRLAGAEPVFAEIDPDTFCLDPDAAAGAVGPRTAALMPVHLYGHPAAMDRLTQLARRHGLAVVEDACQAHAAALDDRPVGAFGDAACFSFYPTKNMQSLEGGMVVVPDQAHARTLRLLRNQGMEQRYENEIVGANMRMTDVAAAVGRVQLTRLAERTERRRAHAAVLDEGLRGLAGLVTPPVAAGARHVYHQYTVRVPGGAEARERVRAGLEAAGVGSAVYYPTPIHRLKPYASLGADLPVTDRAAAEVLSLPVHPALTGDDLVRIVRAARDVTATAEPVPGERPGEPAAAPGTAEVIR